MLYISRYNNENSYCITDTDDGVETTVSRAYLERIVNRYDLHIEGVTLKELGVPKGKNRYFVSDVQVVQLDEFMTRQQSKLKVLNGVDLTINNDDIVALKWTVHRVKPGTQVRLSTFGKSCGKCLLRDCPTYSSWLLPIVTLVLDDSIKIDKRTFQGFHAHGVAIDVQEISSEKTLSCIYGCVANVADIVGRLDQFIIDKPERLDFQRGVLVLNRGLYGVTNVNECLDNPDEVAKKLTDKYLPEFKQLSIATYYPQGGREWATVAERVIIWLHFPQTVEVLESNNPVSYLRAEFMDIFDAMIEVSTCDKMALKRFSNYIKFFGLTKEVEEVFMRFCQRAGKWLLEYGKTRKWI